MAVLFTSCVVYETCYFIFGQDWFFQIIITTAELKPTHIDLASIESGIIHSFNLHYLKSNAPIYIQNGLSSYFYINDERAPYTEYCPYKAQAQKETIKRKERKRSNVLNKTISRFNITRFFSSFISIRPPSNHFPQLQILKDKLNGRKKGK